MIDFFIDIEQLKEQYQLGRLLILWGTKNIAKQHCALLKELEVEISFFVDNNKEMQGKHFNGVLVLKPSELITLEEDYFVIIASGYINEILADSQILGVKSIHVLHYAPCIDFKKVLSDCALLGMDPFLTKTENSNVKKSRILLKFWIGLGDCMIMLGVLHFFKQLDPNGEVFWAVTDNMSKFEFLKGVFPNVIFVDRELFCDNEKYRIAMLRRINTFNFVKTMCFAINHHNYFDLFTVYNTNIPEHIYAFKYLFGKNERMENLRILEAVLVSVRNVFYVPDDYNFCPKGQFRGILDNLTLKQYLPDKFITVGLGSVSWPNAYPPERAALVLDHFISKGFSIILLGNGEVDCERHKRIMEIIPNNVYDFSSELSVYESIKVISKSYLFLGMDSALSHAAYILEKKAVVLMVADKRIEKWKHYDSNMKYVVNYNISCAMGSDCTCRRDGLLDKVGECISLTDPNEIIAAMELLLSQ